MEAGMLSYGADMDRSHNPFELGIEKLVDVDQDVDFIGKQALRRIKAEGVKRKFAAFTLDGYRLSTNDIAWKILSGDREVGYITSAAWSPKINANLALGYLDVELTEPGAKVTIVLPSGEERTGTVGTTPYVVTNKRGKVTNS